MKLIYRILLHLSVVLSAVLTGWAIYFYAGIVEEVNDETDDALDDYAERIIRRYLAGVHLPSEDNGTNNSFYVHAVTEDYLHHHPAIEYIDESVFIAEKGETEPARTLHTVFRDRAGHYFLLSVSTPTIDKDDLKQAILWRIITLYVALLVTILTVNVWVYSRSMRPLHRLLHWLDTYTVGRPHTPLTAHSAVTEFRRLYDAVRRHTDRTEQAFEQQKQFIGNASHELQTPLAVSLGRLELLADSTPALTEAQLAEVIKTQQTLRRAVRLNRSLLFLTKIDNRQFLDQTDLCLDALLRRDLEDLQEVYASRRITVDLTAVDPPLRASMHESLADALVSNLLKNAFVHNHPDGRILIRIATPTLTIANTGPAASLDPTHLFDRFHQGPHRVEGSTGLGLSIVRAICRLYAIDIRYAFTADRLHTFTLTFPLTSQNKTP